MNFHIGDTVLITCDNWFYAPDGQEYRAVFGTLKGIHTAEDTLGIKPNGKSTNWYVEIGNMLLAGCQIHYAVKAPTYHDGKVPNWTANADHGIREYDRPTVIYNADSI
jgi:hypothetical protein